MNKLTLPTFLVCFFSLFIAGDNASSVFSQTSRAKQAVSTEVSGGSSLSWEVPMEEAKRVSQAPQGGQALRWVGGVLAFPWETLGLTQEAPTPT